MINFFRSSCTALVLLTIWPLAANADLPSIIEKTKPSIVAIGTFKKTQSPPFIFRGTGFVISDGNLIATNAHVLPASQLPDDPELAIVTRANSTEGSIRRAHVVAIDTEHDIAVIKAEGPTLPSLKLAESSEVREGQSIAFTGFPIGGVLGLFPVTHHGIVAAITPITQPAANGSKINGAMIRQTRRGSFNVLQLDATAYPGNSGSPVFLPDNGEVIGIVNKVFVKESKESALSTPTGITFAIPVEYINKLLIRK